MNNKGDGIEPDEQAGWQTGWLVRRVSVGQPSLLCRAVIRCPLWSGGLFELYVPLIIHLGYSTLGQAHKDLIYCLAEMRGRGDAGQKVGSAGPAVSR